jgi:hypothetical protein
MRYALQVCLVAVGVSLEILVISAMLKGAYRRFPVAFVYMIAVFVTSLVETSFFILGSRDARYREVFSSLYWIDESILIFLVLGVVVSLFFQATKDSPARGAVRSIVVAASLLAVAITFVVCYDASLPPNSWMTSWSSKVNFCAAILDAALWTMAIGSKKVDRLILTLSGALGIQFTGEAIGGSIRSLSDASRSAVVVMLGNLVIASFNLALLYFWWQAFRRPEASRVARAPINN